MSYGQESTNLIEHRLIGFKTDLGTPVAHGSPCQRNRSATIDEASPDQHEGRQGGRIQGNRETLIHRPTGERCLDHRPIPLGRNNPWVMQPTREAPDPARGVLGPALSHLRPPGEPHAVREAQAGDRPGQRSDPAHILIDRSRQKWRKGR